MKRTQHECYARGAERLSSLVLQLHLLADSADRGSQAKKPGGNQFDEEDTATLPCKDAAYFLR